MLLAGEWTVEKGPPSLPSGFFSSLISSTGDICCLERKLSHTVCQGREWRHFPCHAIFATHCESRGASSAEDRQGCARLCQPCADAGGTGVTSSVSTPLFATRGHRSSGLGLASSSSGNPQRSHPGTARLFSPAARPGFGCPSFSFHLWLVPETCLFCCAHVTAAHKKLMNHSEGQAGSWEQDVCHSGSRWERLAS